MKKVDSAAEVVAAGEVHGRVGVGVEALKSRVVVGFGGARVDRGENPGPGDRFQKVAAVGLVVCSRHVVIYGSCEEARVAEQAALPRQPT